MAYVFWKIDGTTLHIMGHNPPNIGGTPAGYTKHEDTNTAPAWINESSFSNVTTVVFKKGVGITLVSPVYMREWFKGAKSLTTFSDVENFDWSAVTSMYGCFQGCTSITSVNDFFDSQNASSLENMTSCFRGCISLTTAPEIPSSVTRLTDCFFSCASLVSPPEIPNSVIYMDTCFMSCVSLKTAPAIPNSVTDMSFCFNNTGILSAPEIPASVGNMNRCFMGCDSLSGNIVVHNTPQDYTSIFSGTINPIYIINGGNAGSVWKNTIAPAFANVHYEADDNPAPALSFAVKRVGAMNSETEVENGEYAFINATAVLYDTYLPVGWSVSFGSKTLTKDGVTQSPLWTDTNVGLTYTLKCWLSLGDTTKYTFTLQVTDTIKNSSSVTKATHASAVITQILPKAYKLVDYYHESDPNSPNYDTEGMAVGKFATEANLFDVDMPSLFRDTVSLTDGNAAIRLLFDYVYPVGSYYETSKSPSEFDPNVVWGGTWILELQGQVHVSAGASYPVAGALTNTKDGGDSTVKLTKDESGLPAHGHGFTQPKIPNHSHTLTHATGVWMNSTGTKNIASGSSAIRTTNTISVNSSGGGGACTGGAVSQHDGAGATSAHNNMQPYINVWRWHRTA